jgi:hypothetical protein
LISLVHFTSTRPEEFSVVKAKITTNAKTIFGLVNDAEKEYAGKKVQHICLRFAMIVGLM